MPPEDGVAGGAKRFAARVEYDGAPFNGFQRQPSGPTVQGALEEALTTYLGAPTGIDYAGRTDSGVHAVGQAIAFDAPGELDTGRAERSLNGLLQKDVSVRDVRMAPDGFDPRRDALWREYRYFILNRSARSALLSGRACHVRDPLDVAAMNAAAARALGEHDFSAFTCKDPEGSTVREVTRLDVRGIDECDGLLSIEVRANAFLYRMVRILAGALVEVGKGSMNAQEFAGHLDGGEGPCADPLPAHGLYLWHVRYPE